MNYYLLTAFGKDKIGIVKNVTEILYKFNLNIDDSAMIRLNNEFTMMLILEDNNNLNITELEKELKRIEKEIALNIFIKEIEKSQSKNDNDYNIYNILVYGGDRVGIIYNISKILAENGINIIDIFTKKEKSFYIMILKVEIKKNFNIKELEQSINKLKKELNLEIKIEEEISATEM